MFSKALGRCRKLDLSQCHILKGYLWFDISEVVFPVISWGTFAQIKMGLFQSSIGYEPSCWLWDPPSKQELCDLGQVDMRINHSNILPPCDQRQSEGSCYRDDQTPPVIDEISNARQYHSADRPIKTDYYTSNRPVCNISPFYAWWTITIMFYYLK